jgi:hypothetical protein
MPLGSFSFLVPEALLLCVTAVVPLTVLVALARRQHEVVRRLGLEPALPGSTIRIAALTALVCVALGVAAAQPVLVTESKRAMRTESELVVVTDVSRSMLAKRGPNGESRLDRAKGLAVRLRAAAPGVPAGLSGLTDRVLPYLFPTIDRSTFDATVQRSVRLESPPPEQVDTVATSFERLPALVRDGFFSRNAKNRTCVLLTDGETRGTQSPESGGGSLPALGGGSSGGDGAGSVSGAATLAGSGGCHLIVVRIGSSDERIYDVNGDVEAAYRPEANARITIDELARTAGGEAFGEGDAGAAARAVRAAAEVGPVGRTTLESSVRRLAPAAAGVAGLLALLLVAGEARRWLALAGAKGN